jgi:inhibitor of cysteine peptidase
MSPPPVVVTDDAQGSTPVLRSGQGLEVRLPGNPSTGFRWEFSLGSQGVLRQDGEPRFERGDSPPGVVGAGGTEVFRFVPVGAGVQDLSFAYRRPWEKDVPPARTLAFRVSVEGR